MGEPVAFLSEAWFERARELLADLPEQPGVDLRLTFEAEAPDGEITTWHQIVENGQVAELASGPADGADLVLRWPLEEARAVYQGRRTAVEAHEHVRFVEGSELHLVSPLDIVEVVPNHPLPHVPGATITVQYEFADGPFGPVGYWSSFDEGIVAGTGLGESPEEADCRIWVTFQKAIGVRRGEISVLEALEDGGRIDGQVGPLMLIAGLLESEEYLALCKACGRSGPAFATWGLVTRTPEHRQAMAALAAETA